MKNKIILFTFLLLVIFNSNTNPQQANFNNIILLKGSNIYVKIFLFFFPISDNYEPFFTFMDDSFNLEILINRNSIKSEPSTPPYFESDLVFIFKNIPYNISGNYSLPVTIQCNQKFIKKKINFTIYHKDQILILKGALNDLFINEIIENDYFKKRYKWKFPIYFDIRMFINEK